MSADLYEVLGLNWSASAAEIKAAWRKFSKLNHPDKGGDKEAFQRGQQAFEILGDPVKRRIYDETGDSGFAASRQQEIERGIIDVINVVIQSIGERGNIFTEAKKRYRESIRQFLRQSDCTLTELTRLTRIRSRIRFKPKNGERDILTGYFEAREAGCRQTIEQMKRNVSMAEESLKYLEAWEDAGGPESLYWTPVYGLNLSETLANPR